MRQISILPSGCQLNHRNSVLFFSNDRILYASSLAVYVVDSHSYEIVKVLSVNQRSITSISLSPHDQNLLAVGSVDGSICVWNVTEEEVLSRLSLTNGAHVAWDPTIPNKCALIQDHQGIKLLIWDTFSSAANNITEVLHIRNEMLKSSLFRWSPNIPGCIAIGCNAGATIIFKQRENSHKILQASDKKSQVVDLQWDRLSTSYLLVAYQYHLILWDVDQGCEVNSFDKQPISITSIMWLDWTAGNFVTTNTRNHNLKVWNASQASPIDSIKVKAEGGVTSSILCPGKMRCMLAAMDGSIAVYDMKNSRVDFKSAAGHTETIFACKFAPNSPHSFATGSYDGTIKLWATDTFTLNKTLVGNGDIIYCLDWSPTGKMIATSSYSGLITIWDIEQGRELARYLNHTKATFFVAWNQKDERYILSSSADCSVLVLELDFETLFSDVSTAKSIASRRKSADSHKDNLSVSLIKRRYQHEAQVFGVAWSTFHKDLFCTCSQDGIVRVFNAAVEQTVPIMKLSGHTARVFSCAWSPLVEGLLATGSDDYSVIVWQLDRVNELSKSTYTTKKLVGHKGFVRALCWNFENANLLLSGSWDNSIRMWDIATTTCIYELNEHIADVYALTSNPFRPCSYISASRDTTIRLWELQGNFTLMRYYSVWDEHLRRSRTTRRNRQLAELSDLKLNAAVPSIEGILSGQESVRLDDTLSDDVNKCDAEKFYRIFYFYTSAPAYLDVWENISKSLQATKHSSFGFLRSSSLRQVFHESEILSIARASIKSHDSSKAGRRSDGKGVRDESVEMMHCKLGEFQKYCQSLIEEGKWEAALAIAPTVSMKYWQSLVEEYGNVLQLKGSEECVPYLISINRYQDAVEFYLNRNDSGSAMIVAKSSEFRDSVPVFEMNDHSPAPHATNKSSMVEKVGFFEAVTLAKKGQPLLAGAKLIAVGRIDEAISLFTINYEFDLAFAVSKVFERDPTSILGLWAERCALWGAIDLAVEILQQGSGTQKDIEIALLLSKFCDKEEANSMLQSLKLRSIETWMQIAVEEEATGSDNEAVVAHIICREYSRAAEIGISSLNRYVNDPWTASPQNKKLFNSCKKIRAHTLPGDVKLLFLVTMLWFAAHDAILNGALRTASEMLNIILDHCNRVKFPVSEALIQLQMALVLILLGDNYGRNLLSQLRSNSQLVLCSNSLDILIRSVQDEESWHLWTNVVHSNKLTEYGNAQFNSLHPKVRSLVSAIIDINANAKLPNWNNAKSSLKSKLSEIDFILDLALRRSQTILTGSMLPVANQKLKLHPSFISGEKIQGTFFFLDGKPVSINEVANWLRFFPYSPSLNGEFIAI